MTSIKDTADAAALRIMDRIEVARAIHKDDIAHEVARAIREAQRAPVFFGFDMGAGESMSAHVVAVMENGRLRLKEA